MISTAVQTCLPAAKKKNVDINTDIKTDVKIKINQALVEHAVTNLIDNAIKYGFEKGRVDVVVVKVDEELVIKVIDNGPGIEQKHLPRIFERFYRVDKARSRGMGGTGLGLAIVKHIAQVHSGKVDVDSTTGIGSTFYIFLPIVKNNNQLKIF